MAIEPSGTFPAPDKWELGPRGISGPAPQKTHRGVWRGVAFLAVAAGGMFLFRDAPQGIAGLGLLLSLLALYFLPSLVALERKHRQFWPIVILNLFLGWTLIGWVAALVWSATYQPPGTLQLRREWRVR